MNKKELWRNVKGFEGYQISSLGRFRSVDRTVLYYERHHNKWYPKKIKGVLYKTASIYPHSQRYITVSPRINGKNKTLYVHRLVAEAFIPNTNGKPQVNHINGDRTNNRASNLEWVTAKENGSHAARKGLVARGSRQWAAKLSERDIIKIRSLKGKMQYSEISKLYGVSEKYIGEIINRRKWVWL